jgi:hypothetical protein
MTGSLAPASSPARHRFGFWAVAYAFLAVLSFSTAPSPLYVLYAHRDHFSSLMITLIYAAYAAGVAGSLLLASHLSDVLAAARICSPASPWPSSAGCCSSPGPRCRACSPPGSCAGSRSA